MTGRTSIRATAISALLLGLAFPPAGPAPAVGSDVYASRTLPTSLSIVANSIQIEDAIYNFQVILRDYRVVDGVPQLTVMTTITKVVPGGQVQFQNIPIQVALDASSVRLKVDGEEFVIEAGYRDPFDRTTEPRYVTTTFGQMFSGGKVGLVVRLAQ